MFSFGPFRTDGSDESKRQGSKGRRGTQRHARGRPSLFSLAAALESHRARPSSDHEIRVAPGPAPETSYCRCLLFSSLPFSCPLFSSPLFLSTARCYSPAGQARGARCRGLRGLRGGGPVAGRGHRGGARSARPWRRRRGRGKSVRGVETILPRGNFGCLITSRYTIRQQRSILMAPFTSTQCPLFILPRPGPLRESSSRPTLRGGDARRASESSAWERSAWVLELCGDARGCCQKFSLERCVQMQTSNLTVPRRQARLAAVRAREATEAPAAGSDAHHLLSS